MKTIIIQLNGGLGNQLFQYAFGRNLAIINHAELLLDTSSCYSYKDKIYERAFLLKNFQISAGIANQNNLNWANNIRIWQRLGIIPKWMLINENSFDKFEEELLKKYKKNIYIKGYWQNENYFNSISKIIRKEIVFKNSFEDIYKNDILKFNSIGIHIRRGDYVHMNEFASRYIDLFITNYYRNAIKLIKQKVLDSIFYIFSDDIDWCKKSFQFDDCKINFVDKTEGVIHDFFLMTNCKHQIIANSTFSWWSAWLNNNEKKIVICPKKWFLNNWEDSHYSLKE